MVNKVILIGNLGANPEMRNTQSGSSVVNFNVATSERWTGKDGQRQEQTEWHRIVVYGRLGEICGQFLRKGSKVYIEGRLQTREWQDQSGNKKYTTEIVAREMKMLDARPFEKETRPTDAPSSNAVDADGFDWTAGSSIGETPF